MNRYEFITELKEALAGNVSSRVIAENEAFYRNYIEEELRKGRNESEIMEELGSPRLIANTIIDTTAPETDGYAEYTDCSEQRTQQETGLKLFHLSGWLVLLVPIIAIVLVISLVVGIISALPSIFIWIILGVILYKWFRR